MKAVDFALKATGTATPALSPAPRVMTCALCARSIAQGQACRRTLDLPSSFTDHPSLIQGAMGVCAPCAATQGREFMQTWSRAVITEEGVFPAVKNAQLAYWATHPPQGPFVFLYGTAKMQHLIWKARVSTPEMAYLCLEGENYPYRPHKVVEAVQRSRAYLAHHEAVQNQLPPAQRRPLGRPSLLIRSNLRESFVFSVDHRASRDDARFVESLWPGEAWLVVRTHHLDPDALLRPEPLALPDGWRKPKAASSETPEPEPAPGTDPTPESPL